MFEGPSLSNCLVGIYSHCNWSFDLKIGRLRNSPGVFLCSWAGLGVRQDGCLCVAPAESPLCHLSSDSIVPAVLHNGSSAVTSPVPFGDQETAAVNSAHLGIKA